MASLWESLTSSWDSFSEAIPKFADDVWGWGPKFLGELPLMVLLLLGTGIVLTLVTRFVQVRKFRRATALVFSGAFKKDASEKEQGDITPFQALMTALSATVGNGNLAGVATAVASGGPGAAFWMWITAVFGMATKYSEAVLGVKFRKVNPDGSMAGGPMYYCEYGIGGWWGKSLGIMFAVCGTIACLIGTGNMFQTNSMALVAREVFTIPQWVTGAVVTILVGLVIIGGVKRIALVAERLVPTMIILYFAGALIIILMHFADVPGAIALIFKSAFSPRAVLGGGIGIGIREAIRNGVARGILSNESGLGSAPIAHGAAKTKDPVRQGQIAMMGTFIDTIVVCSMTAIVLTVTGAYQHSYRYLGEAQALDSSAMTAWAFNSTLPHGGKIVALAALLFGISTLLGWCYYGEKCLEYLFGTRIHTPYRVIFIVLMFLGSLPDKQGIRMIVTIGDIGNAFMAVPNLLGLLLLAGIVRRLTRGAT